MRIAPMVAAAALAAVGGIATAGTASAAGHKPDTECMQAGMSTLRSEGLFAAVARGGLPISVAVGYGVEPREGTDVAALPDPLPLHVVLADHRAGDSSLFIYPWC